MHLTSLQLSNQRTSQNINTSSNQNHFRISNQFVDGLQLRLMSEARKPQDPDRVQLHATVATVAKKKENKKIAREEKKN